MSDHISKTISVLWLPLAILVVFIHGKMSLVDWDIDTVDYAHLCNADYYSFIVLAFSSIISAIAVPLFFFFSGYLFFCNFQKWDFYIWRKKLHSRVHTILIPYILWILFSYVTIAIGGVVTHHGLNNLIDIWNNHGLMSFVYTSKQLYGYDWFGKPSYKAFPMVVPLWFLRDLIVMFILTPCLHFTMKSNKWGIPLLILLGFLYVSDLFPFLPFLSISAIFMFSLGCWMALQEIDWVKLCNRYHLLTDFASVILFFVLLAVGKNSYVGSCFRPWFILFFSMSCVAITSHTVNKQSYFLRTIENFCIASFFIYVFHCTALKCVTFTINRLLNMFNIQNYMTVEYANEHFFFCISLYFVKIAVAVAFSISLFFLVEKHFPCLSRLMCGGKRLKTIKE